MKKPLLLTLALGMSVASAMPTAFGTKTCGEKPKIINNTNSDVMIDSDDCNSFYVKPPMSGLTKFTSFSPSGNLNFCESMKSITTNIKVLSDTRIDISNRLRGVISENANLTEKIQELELELVKYSETQAFKDIKALQISIEDFDMKIDELITKYDECHYNCSLIRSEINEFKKRRYSAKKQLSQLKQQNYRLIKKADRLQAQIDANNNMYLNNLKLIKESSALVTQLEAAVEQNYKQYGALEGGFANINYDTQWDQNVQKLRDDNPGKEFRPISTKNSRLHVALVKGGSEANYLNSLPMILGYNIAGMAFLPFGEQEQAGQLTALPSKIGGTIRMSLVGACPLYYKNYLDSDTLVINDDIKTTPSFAISATYDYPSAFKFDVKAKYNLYKFYERIEKTSSRGGFFSRKTYHSLIENRVDRDSFSIDWKIEDPDNAMDFEQRMNITKALKEDLVQRVANMAMTPVAPSMLNLPAPTMPQATGVTIFASGLKNVCWGSSYWCRGGYYILKGFGAIFGRTSSNSYFRSTWDRTATEQWSSEIVTWKSGATAFPVE